MDAIVPAPDRQPVSWLRAHWRAAAALAVLLAAIAAGTWFVVFDKAVPTYTATRGDLVQSVVASGTVITPQRASIGTEITGRVARVPVEQGQTVRAGQVLVELDQTDERAALAQARAALAQAEARLRQIAQYALPAAEQALQQAQANLTQAELAYKRASDLVAQNFVSKAALDDAQRNLDVAKSQLRTAQLQVASNRPGGADYTLAEAARREAETAVDVARAKLDATVIRAPANGVLIGRTVEPGDIAQPGKTLLVLAPTGEVQILVNIDEKNLGKLAVGERALASADAYPDQSFPAMLFYINPGIDPVRGSVEVKLRVPDPPPYLKQDMSVSVDIEVARRKDVLIVPADAIRDIGTAHPWAMVVRNAKATRQPVKLGMRGDQALEITEGLAPGDAIIPATNGLVRPGQRVRPHAIAAAG
ncbi:MAG: efflux RND transporter periplasmic adaptor subunit [Rudaea sp.]